MIVNLGCSFCREMKPNVLPDHGCDPEVGFLGVPPFGWGWHLRCILHARSEASRVMTLDFTLDTTNESSDHLPGIPIMNWLCPTDILFVRQARRFLGSTDRTGHPSGEIVPGARLGRFLVFGDVRGSTLIMTLPLVHIHVTRDG